jgi:hypothetical protein
MTEHEADMTQESLLRMKDMESLPGWLCIVKHVSNCTSLGLIGMRPSQAPRQVPLKTRFIGSTYAHAMDEDHKDPLEDYTNNFKKNSKCGNPIRIYPRMAICSLPIVSHISHVKVARSSFRTWYKEGSWWPRRDSLNTRDFRWCDTESLWIECRCGPEERYLG